VAGVGLDLGVGYVFVSADREQRFLLPPDMRDWLAEDHVVWLVLDAVDQLDLAAFRASYRADGHGRPAFDPALMVALLLYAYTAGERSSRRIERRCAEDIAFRVICGGHLPDHATIARFRVRHEQALKDLFSQVLRLLAEAGLVRLNQVALDGTKIAANASWSANKTQAQIEQMLSEAAAADAAEDEAFGAARGDEPPPDLARRGGERIDRLRAARDRLAAEAAAAQAAQDAKVAAWQARKDAGHPRPGRRPQSQAKTTNRNGTTPRANTTDPQARTMKAKHSLIVGYNAQAVVTCDQIVIGALVSQAHIDQNLLHPVLAATRTHLAAAGITPQLATVLADAGYANEATFAQADTDRLRLLCPLAKDTRQLRHGGDPALGRNLDHLPATAAAQRRLRHPQGRADYRQRGRTIEPVFGQIKTRQHLTHFSRRGLTAADSEWHLACTAHNLLKLHHHHQTN
jgi:transposase